MPGMLAFVAAAVAVVIVGVFRAGPAQPLAAVAVVIGLAAVGAAAQVLWVARLRRVNRERYRALLQQYGREFGETDFFTAMVAASGRGFPSEDRWFQRPAGFRRDGEPEGADLGDRRRWTKEAELLRLVGEVEDAPNAFVAGLLLTLVCGLWTAYRLTTPPPIVTEELPPPAVVLEPAEHPPSPADVVIDRPGAPPEPLVAAKQNAVRMRFTLDRCGSVTDADTGLRWYIGPDTTFQRRDAEAYVRGMRACDLPWRLPTAVELRAIYDPQQTAGVGYERDGARLFAHLSPMFSPIGQGLWVWMESDGDFNAFSLLNGAAGSLPPEPGDEPVRVMAVSAGPAR